MREELEQRIGDHFVRDATLKGVRGKMIYSESGANNLIRAIEGVTGIDHIRLASPRRYRELADVRLIFYMLARKYTDLSFSKIGEYTDRDHSTVVVGDRVANDLVKNDAKFRGLAEEIEKAFLN